MCGRATIGADLITGQGRRLGLSMSAHSLLLLAQLTSNDDHPGWDSRGENGFSPASLMNVSLFYVSSQAPNIHFAHKCQFFSPIWDSLMTE
jgi:hypothetical protein